MSQIEVGMNERTVQPKAVEQREENIYDRFSADFVTYAMSPEINYALDHTFDFMKNMSNGDIVDFLYKANSPDWRPINHPLWQEFCKGAEDAGLNVDGCYSFLICMIEKNFGLVNETSLRANIERMKNDLKDIIIKIQNLPEGGWRI